MKKSYRVTSFLLLLLMLDVQLRVSAQQTRGTSPVEFSMAQVRSFFSEGMYESVLSLGQNSIVLPAFFNGLSDSEKEEWRYMQLASGIVLNDAVAVKQAESSLQSIGQYGIAVKLAYHLGHHYFLMSMFAQALTFLEKTDDLYLNLAEQHRVQFEKGVAYFTLKKFDNASPYFKNMLQLKHPVYADDASYYLGFIAFSEKKYTEALPLFESLEKNPTYATVVPFYLAYIYNVRGEWEKAIRFGESYLKKGNGLQDIETMQLLASIYYNRQNFTRTIELYEQAIAKKLQPIAPQQFELGSAYHAVGQHAKAISLLKPLSVGGDTVAVQSMYVLGFAYLQLNDKTNARSALQYALNAGLDKLKTQSVRLLVAKLSMEMGFEDQAVQSLKDFLVAYPDGNDAGEARDILLMFYARTNGFRQAMDLLKAAERKPEIYNRLAPRIFFGRGIELINELQYDKADQLMAEVTGFKNSVYHAPALFWRAEIAFRNEGYLATVNYLTAYLNSKPIPVGEATVENALYNLGYAHLELEEYTKAIGYFEKLYTTKAPIEDDLRREAAIKVADCAFMEKNLSKAKMFYSKIANTTGYGSDYAGFQLAVMEGITSPPTKISLLKKLERDFPESDYATLIAMELADTYMGEEQFGEAIPYLKKISSMVEKEDELVPLSFLKWGICLYNMGMDDEAIAKYKEILQQFPSSEQASIALDNSKVIFVEKGRINDYQQFLESGGRSMAQLQKDSLFFQYVQTAYAEGKSSTSLEALQAYMQQFPEGLFIADVMNYKAELHVRERDWVNAAAQFSLLASKGASKYQERSLRQAGKIYFFELKEYASALDMFRQLSALTLKPDVLLESLRGELRCFYHLKQWKEGSPSAERLLALSGINQDDLAYAQLIVGYQRQLLQSFSQSTGFFESVVMNNNAALAAEARYQIASNHFTEQNLEKAEKAALETIETAGSYLYWVTRSYLLLANIFIKQKDYFNAKATLRSVIDNSSIQELKEEAKRILGFAEQAESGTINK